jgi:hypothetical protein
MTFEIRAEYGLILGIYGALVLFGFGFNALIAWFERKGYMEGMTSLMVVLGVALTIAPFALINLHAVLMIAGGFVASGLPMIIGSLGRYLKQRDEARKFLAERLERYGNKTPDVAR